MLSQSISRWLVVEKILITSVHQRLVACAGKSTVKQRKRSEHSAPAGLPFKAAPEPDELTLNIIPVELADKLMD